MRPALLAGAVLAFTLSINDFIFAFLLGGSTPTIPVFMWSMLTTDISPEVNALSSLLIAGMLALFLIPMLIRTAGRRAERRPRLTGRLGASQGASALG
jgi:spermidine/putrescine transport system permease protein